MDADKLDATVSEESASGHHGVRFVAHLQHVGGVGAVERVEAAGAVGRRGDRLKGAVFVDADQLDAVVVLRDDHGVPVAAHFERVNVPSALERVEGGARRRRGGRRGGWRVRRRGGWRVRRRGGWRGKQRGGAVGCRCDRIEGAIPADACQLDAVVGMPCGHHCVYAATHFERVDGAGAIEDVEAVGAVGRRSRRREGAVFVDADQLDATAHIRGPNVQHVQAGIEFGIVSKP